ncbi:MAG: TonB-dependent receptor [Deltaproteobacteria bacterium]|nr:TonB-dependent receptor [Deltaproteobacteria bacterium]
MTTKKLLIAATLGASSLLSHLVAPELAQAQSNTTGALTGTITDSKTKEPLPGVTVIATSASLQSAQTAITDEKGQYRITSLPPGQYLVTFYYADITLERDGIIVGVNKVTPVYQSLNQDAAGGEVVKITDSAPTIDPTSTAQGITIDKNYINNIPVPGRNFESTLGAAAGSQGDGLGVSFSGSSSLENQYYVDGVNTTGLTFGTVGSPVINNFIEEIEVITGGYNAEFGRATGAVVNVVTKSGSNEFKGSVFGTFQPGALTREANVAATNATSLDFNGNVAYNADFGVELGGPIIKDKLWFYVGFAPQFAKVDITRIPKRQTDCRMVMDDGTLSICNPALSTAPMPGFANGEPDVDPATGFLITDPLCGPDSPTGVECEVRSDTSRSINLLGKLNYALNPENQGQLTIQALPGHSNRPGDAGLVSTGAVIDSLVTDVSFKWTSKFNDNKTEIEAVVGWHREATEVGSIDPSLNNTPAQVLQNGNLAVWARGFGGETAETLAGCTDDIPGRADPYPNIDNCPMRSRSYRIGGPGGIANDSTERRAAKLGLIQRVKAAGTHEIKAGIDVENNLSNTTRLLSGGAILQNLVGNNQVRVQRYVQLTDDANMDPRFDKTCHTPDPNATGPTGDTKSYKCDFLGGQYGDPGTDITGNTFNWSAYLRDSWQIQPNLTFNAGVRYEEQRLRYAADLQNTTDALTGLELGKNAMTLTGMFAPRLGILYDWTKEGRSKIYTHWGRFYESIPMRINDRSFGGEAFYVQDFVTSGMNPPCGPTDPKIGGPNGEKCIEEPAPGEPQKVGASEQIIGASGVLIAPGIKSQYMDEIIAGFEYEILDDLKIGLSYQNRRMGRVIEDVSTDGAETYIIANPGEWDQDEENKLQARIDRTDDLQEKNRLLRQLKLFQGIRTFDKPSRDYNALQFTLTRRFSKKLYVQGSYTYSRITGNYPGLISYDNGQVDPNISSQYDLIELLANRIGPLPQDRPHYIKLDGYYTFDLKSAGELTTGIRLRALSGIPQQALAGHYLYGPDESFLLPRGQIGRTDFEHGLDIHVAYARKLNKNMRLEIYADIFNAYNRQGSAATDDTYAPQFALSGDEQNANPIAGGTYEDLMWLKAYDGSGNETAKPIGRNPNYRNTVGRYGPSNVRLGMRLTF